MQKQNGFTLIELVVVIIILGILAVTAAPKFINLQTDARASTVNGVKGALQSANALVYSKAALKGLEKAENQSVLIATGVSVTTDFGYLDSSTTTDLLITNLEKAMDMDFQTLASNTVSVTDDWGLIRTDDTTFSIVPKGKTSADACRLDYTTSTQASGTAPIVLPTYTAVVTDC
ncbi:prepilin-type N-terminal cleavage/methylation domain-containing protein [Shewanella gelidimarina]|uniref:type II secretion system protein n=1 Tax=Shewanella gelidimarina TaxID=56813 RepID=UPI002010C377|nr:prepilin-type N-terminal cleavage/methylation domain-containing protein [Shewanella gelidimarina]MCL1057130.1 prepilin-type N-terminal cleavage/methylation domain-containing protein [Shewanella gelidimarina]